MATELFPTPPFPDSTKITWLTPDSTASSLSACTNQAPYYYSPQLHKPAIMQSRGREQRRVNFNISLFHVCRLIGSGCINGKSNHGYTCERNNNDYVKGNALPMALKSSSGSPGPRPGVVVDSDATLLKSKQLSEVLSAIQENLSKSLSKNDSLLEAIESSEVRATQTGSNEVVHDAISLIKPFISLVDIRLIALLL